MRSKIVLCIICLAFIFRLHANDFIFRPLIVKDQLFMGSVTKLYHDRKGYIWIGCIDGLYKYNGTKYSIFKHEANDTLSISNDYITSIIEDSNGNLWISTTNGLNKYDAVNEVFQRFYINPDSPDFLTCNNIVWLHPDSNGLIWILTHGGIFRMEESSGTIEKMVIPVENSDDEIDDIRSFLEDSEGNFWFGTSHGLMHYIVSEGSATVIKNVPGDKNSLINDFVNFLHEESPGKIWVGTYGGLNYFDVENKHFTHYTHDPNDENTICSNQIRCIIDSGKDTIWITTTNGLCMVAKNMNTQSPVFHNFYSGSDNFLSLNSNSLSSIITDNEGRLWVGVQQGGVRIYDKNHKKFERFSNRFLYKNSLSHNNVSCFAEDKYGSIWITTDGGGLNKMDVSSNTFLRIHENEPLYGFANNKKTLAVLADSRNYLWVGYWFGGIDRMDLSSKKVVHYSYNANDKNSIASNNIFYLFEDSKDNIWICHWEAGITRYNLNTGFFTRYPGENESAKGLFRKSVRMIFEDKDGIIWIGTENYGLFKYNYNTDTFKEYRNIIGDTKSISNNSVVSFAQDYKGRLWLGTMGGGINLYHPEDDSFESFGVKEGLNDNYICGILEDEQGYLWLSTHNGITRFLYKETDKEPEIICRNYQTNGGIQQNVYNNWAFMKDSKNRMYFGGIYGFTRFKPEEIIDNSNIPKIKITDIYIFDERLSSHNKYVKIDKPVDELKKLEVNYKHSMLTFEFSALSYTEPMKNSYAYKLEGFDADWNYIGHYNKAVYTNLSPGKYTFWVKAANNDGVWNEKGVKLLLIVKPPYWKTIWFKTILILFLLAGVYIVYRHRIKRLTLELDQRRKYEIKLTEAKTKAEESNKMKTAILDNISHEIRTPISGILGFTELLLNPNIDAEKKERYMNTIKGRYYDLMNTLDAILDISVIVSGGIEINKTTFALVDVLDDVIEITNQRIHEDKKTLHLEVEHFSFKPPTIVGDANKLKTMLWHLLDNAVKFTDIGKIKLSYKIFDDYIEFSIADEGIGIEEGMKEKIFEQFQQSDYGLSRKYGGIGLGLSLCKGFMDILGGKIWFKSEKDKGSVFYFSYPCRIVEG